jgi:hypothetical protein
MNIARSLLLALPAALLAVACSAGPVEPGGDEPQFDTAPVAGDGNDTDFEKQTYGAAPWTVEEGTNAAPAGAEFDNATGLYIANGKAVGPFTLKMVYECQVAKGVDCTLNEWPIEQAIKLRGKAYCPNGAAMDAKKGVCVENGFVIGPMAEGIVEICEENGGGAACKTLRFESKYIPDVPDGDYAISDEEADGVRKLAGENCQSVNAKMLASYASKAGYANVKRIAGPKLNAITGTGPTANGCASYLSVALQQAGAPVKFHAGTEEFRDGLLKLGWKKIPADQLQPGDVFITRNRVNTEDHPDHVGMYQGDVKGRPGFGYVVDNQGFTHARNITVAGPKTRVAYGLRDPKAGTTAGCTKPVDPVTKPAGGDNCVGRADGWYCAGASSYGAYQCRGSSKVWNLFCAAPQVCQSGTDSRGRVTGSESSGFNLDCTTSKGECDSDAACAKKSGTICIVGACVSGKR